MLKVFSVKKKKEYKWSLVDLFEENKAIKGERLLKL